MSSSPAPPSPAHLLRSHLAPINTLWFSDDNERLYSGDSSGTVTITSTRTLRSLAAWKAHTNGILGVQEWDHSILTHGRDNKLHVWRLPQESATKLREAATQPGLPVPELRYSMDVNALNYCRFSLMPLSECARMEDTHGLIALPNLVESSFADVWTLPSRKRLHAAIGKAGVEATPLDGRVINSLGIIMSMHLYEQHHPNVAEQTQLRLLCAYENGSVTLRAFTRKDKQTSVEGIGWDIIWSSKLHVESVMAMAVTRDNTLALSVSADHLIGRYDILAAEEHSVDAACTVHRTKHPGNAAIAIRDDGKVCAVGGWDGKIRLYSTKTLRPLGTLDYHKKSCQTVVFARSLQNSQYAQNTGEDDDSDDEMSEDDKAKRSRWLAAGSQDHRVSIWPLISFGKT